MTSSTRPAVQNAPYGIIERVKVRRIRRSLFFTKNFDKLRLKCVLCHLGPMDWRRILLEHPGMVSDVRLGPRKSKLFQNLLTVDFLVTFTPSSMKTSRVLASEVISGQTMIKAGFRERKTSQAASGRPLH